MPCGKNMLVVNENPFDQKRFAGFLKNVLKGKFFKFVKVDIQVLDELHDKISEMTPLFVVQEIRDCNISKGKKMYQEKTCRKSNKGTKKLLGVMKAKKIFLYTPMV